MQVAASETEVMLLPDVEFAQRVGDIEGGQAITMLMRSSGDCVLLSCACRLLVGSSPPLHARQYADLLGFLLHTAIAVAGSVCVGLARLEVAADGGGCVEASSVYHACFLLRVLLVAQPRAS